MDNEKTKQKILNALNKSKKETISESRIIYNDSISERIHPELEKTLRERKHSLGEHPAFPSSDESHFEEKIISKRFEEVVNRVKRSHDIDRVNDNFLKRNMMGMVTECMKMESTHKKKLEELAEAMIRKEFDMSKDDVDVVVELTNNINMVDYMRNDKPVIIDEIEFESHGHIEKANDEVYKRRLLNAMIQGSAKKSSHMFHEVEDDLLALDPRLASKYDKLMSAADYMYYVEPDLKRAVSGGVVKVDFPKNEGEKPLIHAKGMVFPVLIHELVKGVMELLSSHGLPQDNNIRKYVIGKSDYIAAEPWDMRLGPGIWESFVKSIPVEDFNIKHHVYSEIAGLPVNEFNSLMKEIMAGTKSGKQKVSEIINEIKSDIKKEEFNEAIEIRRNSYNDIIDNPDDLDNIDLSKFGL